MTKPSETIGAKPHLYHAPPSYYSMIARLALAEGGVAYEPVFVDIHFRLNQEQPDYVRLNPNMTVPTLVLADRVLDQSRDIAEYAFGVSEATLSADAKSWLDLHYALPIEELTFGTFLARNPLARLMIPKVLARSHRRLLERAVQNPDLAPLYQARAKVFAERLRIFSPAAAEQLADRRRAQAIDILDRMERALGDGRATLTPPAYGVADAVLTVFLARIAFIGLGAELSRRPALERYWRAMQARPSFAAADIWTKAHIFRLLKGILLDRA
ncbi:glutathione S-transferase family protein [Methylocapsa acidiphila]|uniref:glutathione S-transferase family protein n=1 Tax=Methylocapsa acidiphila TaxID=133552 RepID=UPI0003FED0A1|nr:glutathione S-transferase family protein [Methylocapsa acidiphila]